ncbi:MAG: putative toxin-antitoxin system toxin component, PIN family [Anaeromyxobacteraceae bacterium]
MRRAVLDTNVVVSAVLSPGGTPAAIVGAAGVAFRLVWSPGIAAECLRVLSYERIARRLRALGKEEAGRATVVLLAAGAEIVAPDMLPSIRVVDADPSDDLLIATAMAGRASELVTGGRKHLLALREVAGIRIVDPATFARELGLTGHPPSGTVHEPADYYGDGVLQLAVEAQRWARLKARRAGRARP